LMKALTLEASSKLLTPLIEWCRLAATKEVGLRVLGLNVVKLIFLCRLRGP
jgi:hypothetical protein